MDRLSDGPRVQQQALFPLICAAITEPMSEAEGRILVEPLSPMIWDGGRAALAAANASAATAVEHGNSHTGRTFGVMLTEFMWQRMTDHFAEQPECNVIDSRRLIRIEDLAYLRFRSLREDGLPWPPQSETGCRITRQVPVEVSELTDLPVLTIGYRLRPARDEFSYVTLLCLKDENEWWWRADIADSEIQPAANDPIPGNPAPGEGPRTRYSKKATPKNGVELDASDKDS